MFVCGSRSCLQSCNVAFAIYFKLEITRYKNKNKHRREKSVFGDLFRGECAIFCLFLSISSVHHSPIPSTKSASLPFFTTTNDDSRTDSWLQLASERQMKEKPTFPGACFLLHYKLYNGIAVRRNEKCTRSVWVHSVISYFGSIWPLPTSASSDAPPMISVHVAK